MKPIFEKVCRDFEAELIECDGESDHIHLLVNYAPKVSIFRKIKRIELLTNIWERRQGY